MEAIFNAFSFLGKKGALFIISMIPLIELRGSIPFGAAMGMEWLEVYLIAVIANMIPIPFIIFFGKKLFSWLKTTKLLGKFCTKYEARLMRKSDKVQKYSFWGLWLFVAIPIPGTGAWSGALLAVLLEVKNKVSFIAIFLGVLTAGVIMTLVSYGVVGAVNMF